MTIARTHHAHQALLHPEDLQNTADLQDVPESWRHALQLHHPCAGLHLHGIHGQPGGTWQFKSAGAAAFGLTVVLEGRMETGFAHDSSGIVARSGSAIVMATDVSASGWNVLDSQGCGHFRMLSIHIPRAAVCHVTGLAWNDLQDALCVQSQCHLLASMPASASLRRSAGALLLRLDNPHHAASHALYVRALALQTLACFLQTHVEPWQAALPAPADRMRLRAARALLENHYSEPWTVAVLARAVGLHEKRLQSGFRALYGMAVHAVLLRIRLDAAIVLLQRGCSVTETAVACGFASLSHFGRVFRGHVGMSPKVYQCCAQKSAGVTMG